MGHAKQRILLVDDDPGIMVAVKQSLMIHGYEMTTASDGLEALAAFDRELPELVLLDLVMPIMTGMEFLAERQQDPSLAAIPVVVLSGVSDFEREAAKFGVAAYLEKPLDPDDLVEKVLEMIKGY